MWLALLALTLSQPPAVPVQISGARVVPIETYLAALKLPDDATASAQTAADVRRQLEAYLHAQGYELAVVHAKLSDDGTAISVELDEGRIDRILFLERLTYPQVRFKLSVALPHDVFNRPLLDQKLEALSERLGTPGVRYEVVRVPPVDHEGPQFFGKTSDYEIHVLLPQPPSHELAFDIRAYYQDGFELEANHVSLGLLGQDDRLRAAASAGVGLRHRVGTGESFSGLYPYFSRGVVKAEYGFSPFGRIFRPTVWADAVVVNRARPDLGIEEFWAFTTDVAAQLDLEPKRGVKFSLGGGMEYRVLFGITAAEGREAPEAGQTLEQARPFARIATETVFDPTVLRWDRRHTLLVEARHYFPLRNDRTLGWADLRYQVVHALGWHDLVAKGRAHVTWGDATLHDELSVGEFARGIEINDYVRTGASALLEARYSLVRDLFKVGAFTDVAVFEVEPEGSTRAMAEWAVGAGPSMHFLVLNMFQVDTYLGFGFRPHRPMHVGFALMLGKVF